MAQPISVHRADKIYLARLKYAEQWQVVNIHPMSGNGIKK